MSIALSRKFQGKKYMWDGTAYETEEQARQISETYSKNGFEVQLCEQDGQFLVYSRRLAAVQTAQ